MMRFVTLVALADISLSGEIEEIEEAIIEVSSAMDAVELFLPKDSFHLEGFFAMAETGEAVGGLGTGGLGTVTLALEGGSFDFDFVSAIGMGYMDTGSNGISRRVFADILEVVLEVLLISRANVCNDCDATASVSNVSSCLRGGTEVSLRFVRTPRLRRLLFDWDLESIPSVSPSISTSRSSLISCSSCSSTSWSMTVDNSEASIS